MFSGKEKKVGIVNENRNISEFLIDLILFFTYSYDDSDRKSIYNVVSETVCVRISSDRDLSRLWSDAKDLEEDIVVMANIPYENV